MEGLHVDAVLSCGANMGSHILRPNMTYYRACTANSNDLDTYLQQSSACTAIVSGLPAMNGGPKKGAERQKIVARLSRLCDNCGGKVINVNAAKRTAHILFRSVEAATK